MRIFLDEHGVNADVDVAISNPVKSKTLADHFEWWEQNKLALRKWSYQDKVTVILKTNILPSFENTPVESIRGEQVQEFIAHLSQTDYKTRDGVSHRLPPVYIRDIVAMFKRIIGKNAGDWELTLPGVPYKEQRYFTQDEMTRTITAASGKWKTFFALLVETGVCRDEAFGLHEKDLDLKSRNLTVRRSIWRGIEGTPKTRKSYRMVDTNPELC